MRRVWRTAADGCGSDNRVSAKRMTLLACLAGLLVLGGCGGGGDDGYGGSAQSAADPVDGGDPMQGAGSGVDPVDAEPEEEDPPLAGNPPAEPAPEEPSDPPAEPPAEPPADPPVAALEADAGRDTAASERTIVYLDGYASSPGESPIAAYRWDQISGPIVALEDPLAGRTRFAAPQVEATEQLVFQLTIMDADGTASTDTVTIAVAQAQQEPDDPDEFLTFLDDLSEIYAGSAAGAEAYYRAIDPLNEKTTLGAWLTANDFAGGADAQAVYRNAADLGFGRVMSMRTRADGSVAAYVENYPTLEDAVDALETGQRDELLATVAMEYSPGPAGGAPYTKFYTFGPDDERITSIDLDGRGAKFMPGLCNVCHGGQPQPLVAGEFPEGGNTNAQFLPWDLETYEFSARPGFTRADQESMLKALNEGSLSTYPDAPSDGHWSGSAARELIEGWYGGDTRPLASFDPDFVPEGWRAEINGGPVGNPSGVEDLYLDVIAPNCRACHVMRGRYFAEHPEGEFIDLSSYAKLMAYSDVLEDLLYGAGTMPDALVTFEQFWSDHDGVIGAERLAGFLGIDATARRPGTPVADPGPSRRAALGTVVLNAGASAFADTFQWSFAPSGRPAGSNATINNANSAVASFTADSPGVYVLRLVVGRDGVFSAPADVRITATFGTATVRFNADIVPVIASSCMACHSEGRTQSVDGIPVRFDEPLALYERLSRYVNVADIAASPLLSKPAGTRHGGGVVPGFDLRGGAGASRANYDRMLQWIAEGLPND